MRRRKKPKGVSELARMLSKAVFSRFQVMSKSCDTSFVASTCFDLHPLRAALTMSATNDLSSLLRGWGLSADVVSGFEGKFVLNMN